MMRRGGSREQGEEEGGLLRLPPLSYCRCAVQEQEGGEWKKQRRGEGKGRKGAPGQHCNSSCSSSQAGRKRKKREAARLTALFSVISHKKTGARKVLFSILMLFDTLPCRRRAWH